MDSAIIRKIFYDSDEYKKTIQLRDFYLRRPQDLEISEEDLVGDEDIDMYGLYLGKEMIGMVLLEDISKEIYYIKAIIIEEKYKGKGYGRMLMDFAEEKSREKSKSKITLKARYTAIDFYKKLGYTQTSEEHIFKKLPHIDMEKEI